MRITKPTTGKFPGQSAKEDLELFLQQPDPRELAVCPGCKKQVLEDCSASCMDAAKAMSSEPEQYPIEQKIVGLVYELMATRLIEPCWSCEGHMDPNNALWKLPQVCFYTASPMYVKLLCRHLSELQLHNQLTYRWHIVISDFSQTTELTYSIQPDLNHENDPHLGMLQTDLSIIADGLQAKLKSSAQNLIAMMDH